MSTLHGCALSVRLGQHSSTVPHYNKASTVAAHNTTKRLLLARGNHGLNAGSAESDGRNASDW
jgi:hypothetical protein